jgi:type IV pilus assembly protein PilM
MKLPLTDLKKAARIAPFELEADLPVAVPEVVLELFPLPALGKAPVQGENGNGNGGGPAALAFVTSRERLQERLALLAAAELSPRAIEADALALYLAFRALRPAHNKGEALTAVLDIGARKSNLLVVRGPNLEAMRTIPWGGDAVTLALGGLWEVPFGQAERIKRERCSIVRGDDAAQASKKRLEASEAICATLAILIREVKRTLLTCAPEPEALGAEARCGRLYICGGGSLVSGLPGRLAQELGCEVLPLAATRRLRVSTGYGPTEEALLPTALGLALRGLRRWSPVDFRRPELLEAQDGTKQKPTVVYVCATLALVAVLGIGDLRIRATSREDRLKALKARAEELFRGAFPGKGPVPDPLGLMKTKLKEAEDQPLPDSYRPRAALEIMRAVAAAAGGENTKVKVMRFSADDYSAHIEGEAQDKDTLGRFQAGLQKTKLFKDCVVKSQPPQKSGRVAFVFDFKRV